jgi:LuxR family transcriptional regulator, quorum-sensing system regulator SolR
VDRWQEDSLQAALVAHNQTELFAVLSGTAKQLGFDYCAYGMRAPVPINNPKVSIFSNYSQEWQATYAQEGFVRIDPTVRHGMRSSLPLVWTDELFAAAPEFWEAASAHGLNIGWAQSCVDSAGNRGMLTLARSAEGFSETELSLKTEKMSWLAQIAHSAMARLTTEQLAPRMGHTPLTTRELEVLRWTADGKTSGEVGDILNITERTVNFHINQCIEKLGVNNKLSAAVRAAMLGLLF